MASLEQGDTLGEEQQPPKRPSFRKDLSIFIAVMLVIGGVIMLVRGGGNDDNGSDPASPSVTQGPCTTDPCLSCTSSDACGDGNICDNGWCEKCTIGVCGGEFGWTCVGEFGPREGYYCPKEWGCCQSTTTSTAPCSGNPQCGGDFGWTCPVGFDCPKEWGCCQQSTTTTGPCGKFAKCGGEFGWTCPVGFDCPEQWGCCRVGTTTPSAGPCGGRPSCGGWLGWSCPDGMTCPKRNGCCEYDAVL